MTTQDKVVEPLNKQATVNKLTPLEPLSLLVEKDVSILGKRPRDSNETEDIIKLKKRNIMAEKLFDYVINDIDNQKKLLIDNTNKFTTELNQFIKDRNKNCDEFRLKNAKCTTDTEKLKVYLEYSDINFKSFQKFINNVIEYKSEYLHIINNINNINQ
jgi:hypothetical protein